MSLLEEDLTCPICHEIFSDPVVLSCSHSFCRRCQERCWDSRLRECPVCRKKSAKSSHFPNLVLKNICEALVSRREMEAVEERLMCPLHKEKYKLFCLEDKEPICVVCQCSKVHKDHQCLPVEEAATDCKEKLNDSLKSLQDKLDKLKTIHKSSADMFKHIKDQAAETQSLIRAQFEQLRQMLGREEEARLAAVKREEEEKMVAMNDKMKEMSAEMLSLSESIEVVRQLLKEDDLLLLKKFQDHEDGRNRPLGSDNMCGILIDVTNHLSNLKYRVWEKMLENIDYTPVTLDPNTAHPCLILSDDLTSCHYRDQMKHCPDNPERFHVSAEVVGATALGSGSHRWVVQTRSNQDWLLGVASSSIPRNTEVNARPENGFWTLCFREGAVKAMTSPPTPLAVSRMPERIRVHVDYDKGAVMFWDAENDSLIYAFEQTFDQTLLPYFYTQSEHPLKILPERVLVTMLRQ